MLRSALEGLSTQDVTRESLPERVNKHSKCQENWSRNKNGSRQLNGSGKRNTPFERNKMTQKFENYATRVPLLLVADTIKWFRQRMRKLGFRFIRY